MQSAIWNHMLRGMFKQINYIIISVDIRNQKPQYKIDIKYHIS